MSVVEFSADAWQASSPGLAQGLARRVEAVDQLAQGLQALAVSDQIKGEGADAMRAYIAEVHGPILQCLLLGLNTFQTAVGVYWAGYGQVDTGGNFRLVKDELDAHASRLGAGAGTVRGWASELLTIAGDASHLVSLGGAGATQADRLGEELDRMQATVKGLVDAWEGFEGSDHGFGQVRTVIGELGRIITTVGGLSVGRGRSYRPGSFGPTLAGLEGLTAGMVEYCRANQDAAAKGWKTAFDGFTKDLEALEKARREQAGWDLIWDELQVVAGVAVMAVGLGLTPFTAGTSLGLTVLGGAMVVGGLNNAINHYSIKTTGKEFNLAGMAAEWLDANVAKPVAKDWGSPFGGGVISGVGHAVTGMAQFSVKDTAVGAWTAFTAPTATLQGLWNQLADTGAQIISGNWYKAGQVTGELAALLIPGAVAAKTARAAGVVGKAGEAAGVAGTVGKAGRAADSVQALTNELIETTRRRNVPGYDPTGGLGWGRFMEKYFQGFDAEGRPRWNWPEDPPHKNGFLDGISKPADLVPGDKLERITFLDKDGLPVDGNFAAPPGTPFSKLSLPPDRLGSNTTVEHYEILKSLPDNVRMGEIAAGFGQSGHGTQYHFPNGIQKLVDQGYLKEIP